jgi:hypothetical protein
LSTLFSVPNTSLSLVRISPKFSGSIWNASKRLPVALSAAANAPATWATAACASSAVSFSFSSRKSKKTDRLAMADAAFSLMNSLTEAISSPAAFIWLTN